MCIGYNLIASLAIFSRTADCGPGIEKMMINFYLFKFITYIVPGMVYLYANPWL